MNEIKIKKLNDKAVIPTYASVQSAGADLYCICDDKIEILPGRCEFVHTYISIEIPKGYVGLVCARSGLSTKKGLAPANKVGVIDADYRGEIMVALYNQSDSIQTISNGERIAQLVITPFLQARFIQADNLTDTQRGENGFGSTGK